MAWLVRHAANIVTWTIQGPDGLTAFQRVRSKPFRTRLLRFAVAGCDKARAQELLPSSGDGRRWQVGISVGVNGEFTMQ